MMESCFQLLGEKIELFLWYEIEIEIENEWIMIENKTKAILKTKDWRIIFLLWEFNLGKWKKSGWPWKECTIEKYSL